MFVAKLVNSATLKSVVDALKDLLSEASFDCDSTGIHVQAMDNTHSVLVNLSLLAEDFTSYRCDTFISMGINIKSLVKIFKTANDTDAVTIIHDELNTPDIVTFTFECTKNDNNQCRYDMKLMNLDSEELVISTTEMSCRIRLPSAVFAKICRDQSQFGTELEILCRNDVVKFSSKDTETVSGSATLSQAADEESLVIELEGDPLPPLSFESRFLNYFAKATSFSSQVQLSLSADMPLRVEYCVLDRSKIVYYLAPKIKDEMDD